MCFQFFSHPFSAVATLDSPGTDSLTYQATFKPNCCQQGEKFLPCSIKKKTKTKHINLYLLPNFSPATCFRLGSSLLPHGEIQDGYACFVPVTCSGAFPAFVSTCNVCAKCVSRGVGRGGRMGGAHPSKSIYKMRRL